MCILCFIRFFTPIMFVGRPTVYTMQCHRAGLFFTNTQGTHVLSSSIELRHCASLRASCQPSIPTSEVSAITLAHTWPTSHALLRLGKEHPNLLFFPRFLVLQRWSPPVGFDGFSLCERVQELVAELVGLGRTGRLEGVYIFREENTFLAAWPGKGRTCHYLRRER